MLVYKKNLQGLAKKLREKAAIGKEFKKIPETSIATFTTKVAKNVEIYKTAVDIYARTAGAAVSLLKAVSEDEKFLASASTMLGNIRQDIANRTNEVANIVDLLAANEKIEQVVEAEYLALKVLQQRLKDLTSPEKKPSHASRVASKVTSIFKKKNTEA